MKGFKNYQLYYHSDLYLDSPYMYFSNKDTLFSMFNQFAPKIVNPKMADWLPKEEYLIKKEVKRLQVHYNTTETGY